MGAGRDEILYRAENDADIDWARLGLSLPTDAPISLSPESFYRDASAMRIDAIHAATLRLFDVGSLKNPQHKNIVLKEVQRIRAQHLAELERVRQARPHDFQAHHKILSHYLSQVEGFIAASCVDADDKKITGQQVRALLNKAEQYLLLDKPRPILVTVIEGNTLYGDTDNHDLIINIEKPLAPISEAMAADYLAIIDEGAQNPEWFTRLDANEQRLLRYILMHPDPVSDSASLERRISSLPSRLRTLPGVANFSEHQCWYQSASGELTLLNREFRSSMIASRDIFDASDALQEKFAHDNLSHAIETARAVLHTGQEDQSTVLLQTLISNVPLVRPIDDKLYTVKSRVIDAWSDSKARLFSTNHPLNPLRHIRRTEPGTSSYNSGRAFNQAARAETFPESIVNQATEDYGLLLDRPAERFQEQRNNRELFLASLESIIITRFPNGFSFGSCVSGKDRKAIEIIHTDAMALYAKRYGALPRYEDEGEKRANFVRIFTQLYVSRHQQVNASMNAPGAMGLQEIKGYCPQDILAAIQRHFREAGLNPQNEDRNKTEHTLAKTNELKKIPAALGVTPAMMAQRFRRLITYYTFPEPKTAASVIQDGDSAIDFLSRLRNQLIQGNKTKGQQQLLEAFLIADFGPGVALGSQDTDKAIKLLEITLEILADRIAAKPLFRSQANEQWLTSTYRAARHWQKTLTAPDDSPAPRPSRPGKGLI